MKELFDDNLLPGTVSSLQPQFRLHSSESTRSSPTEPFHPATKLCRHLEDDTDEYEVAAKQAMVQKLRKQLRSSDGMIFNLQTEHLARARRRLPWMDIFHSEGSVCDSYARTLFLRLIDIYRAWVLTLNSWKYVSIMKTVTPANVDISKFLSPLNLEMIQKGTHLKRDDFILLRMLEEGAHADITLTTQDGSVRAHRSVLACVSPVFNAMFNHDMEEQLTSTVNIQDMTTDGLQLFLLLLYTATELKLDKCPHIVCMLQFWTAVHIHYAELCKAFNKYQVKHSGVRSVLESALVHFLSVENCLHYYDILLQLESDPELCELFKVTKNYIVGNYHRVIKSESFLLQMVHKPRQVYQLIKAAEPPGRRATALQSFHASFHASYVKCYTELIFR